MCSGLVLAQESPMENIQENPGTTSSRLIEPSQYARDPSTSTILFTKDFGLAPPIAQVEACNSPKGTLAKLVNSTCTQKHLAQRRSWKEPVVPVAGTPISYPTNDCLERSWKMHSSLALPSVDQILRCWIKSPTDNYRELLKPESETLQGNIWPPRWAPAPLAGFMYQL